MDKKLIAKYTLIVLAIIAGAGLFGWFFGALSAIITVPSNEFALPEEDLPAALADTAPLAQREEVPLFLMLAPDPNGDWKPIWKQIELAAHRGVNTYILPLPMSWEALPGFSNPQPILEQVRQLAPHAEVYFQLDLNPTKAWLEQNPGAKGLTNDNEPALPSVTAEAWRATVEKALQQLTASLTTIPQGEYVKGFVLTALKEGAWFINGVDHSLPNEQGFRHWLKGVYVETAQLQNAWKNPSLTFEQATIPTDLKITGHFQFLAPASAQDKIDFLQYTSESIADTIARLTAVIKQAPGTHWQVLAPYGYSFEMSDSRSGHFALELLLNSDVDGFISPISYIDRGMGGTGGVMGPVHSAAYRGKSWYFLDDTRTNIMYEASTDTVQRVKGIRSEAVFNVQKRNFAQALTFGGGIIWADQNGEGKFCDPEQWNVFANMQTIYRNLQESDFDKTPFVAERAQEIVVLDTPATEPVELEDQPVDLLLPDEEDGEGEMTISLLGNLQENNQFTIEATAPPVFSIEYNTQLVVVTDEVSRFYYLADELHHQTLMIKARDAALRAGIATEYCLLSDVIDGAAPLSPVYLFLNVFHLTEEKRARIHAFLARSRASALWLYAPGYVSDTVDVDNISATVGMKVYREETEHLAGSYYTLTGEWLDTEDTIGQLQPWQPLFYVEDPQADVIAQYQQSKKASIAVRFMPEKWTSLYIAEPQVTVPLLCQIFNILDRQLYIQPMEHNPFGVVLIGKGLLSLHSRKRAEYTITLNHYYTIQDLFDENIGWQEQNSFSYTMGMGETRLFHLTENQPGATPKAE